MYKLPEYAVPVWHQEVLVYEVAPVELPVGCQEALVRRLVAPMYEVQEGQAQLFVMDPLAPVYLGRGWLDQVGWMDRFRVEGLREVLLPALM